jgi:DNA-binding LytR/AlgR family response regulator
MRGKLKCLIVDDDILAIQEMKAICAKSPNAELVYYFTSPEIFLNTHAKLHYDVCIFDIVMPEVDGFTLCSMVSKPVILVTGVVGKLADAIDMIAPVDVLRKPIQKERFEVALEKARKFIAEKNLIEKKPAAPKEYVLFNTIMPGGKVSIRLSDVLYVKTDSKSHRNKLVTLKDGNRYIISDTSFEELLSLAKNLIRINKSELVSLEAFHKIDNDIITLRDVISNGKPKQVYLNRWFRKSFFERLSLR